MQSRSVGLFVLLCLQGWIAVASVQAQNLSTLLGGVVDVRLYGAKGNGIADDTAAIRKAINAVPAGGAARP